MFSMEDAGNVPAQRVNKNEHSNNELPNSPGLNEDGKWIRVGGAGEISVQECKHLISKATHRDYFAQEENSVEIVIHAQELRVGYRATLSRADHNY